MSNDIHDLLDLESGDLSRPSTPPMSIFDLISARRWDEAKGWIDMIPECAYEQSSSQHRTPLHVICRMKFGAAGGSSGSGSGSDNGVGNTGGDGESEDDEEDEARAAAARRDRDDFHGALSVAKALIDASHLASPAMTLHPVQGHEFDRSMHNSVLTVQDVYGDTPLGCICGNFHGGSAELVRLLLENTADYLISKQSGAAAAAAAAADSSPPSSLWRKRMDGKPIPTVYDLLSDQNFHGCTPLHFCADGGCTREAVELVLDACYNISYESSSKDKPVTFEDEAKGTRFTSPTMHELIRIQDEDGDTPLHFACSAGLPPDVLRLFVMQKGGAEAIHMKTYGGRLPVDDLITWCIDQYGLEPNITDPPLEERMPENVANELWSRIEVLLQAAYTERGDSGSYKGLQVKFRPIHAAASFYNFPAIVLRMACRRFGMDGGLLERDEIGRVALHCASDPLRGMDYTSAFDLGSGEYTDLARWGDEDSQFSLMLKRCDPITPITHLMNLCPEALRIPCQHRRLPLHLAILSSQLWCDIHELLSAAPETLAQRDGFGLLPFMLAAIPTSTGLDRSFILLQMNPELIRDTTTTSYS